MQNTPIDERTLSRRLAELERRIASLETAPRAGNTSVSGGQFTVLDGETELFRVGGVGEVAGEPVRGTRISRPGGQQVFLTWSGESGGYFELNDQAGNRIFADDAAAGEGIARPFIGAPLFAPADTSTWPKATSSSYATLFYGQLMKQQPQLHLEVWTVSDASSSGDIRISCNGGSTTQHVAANDSTIRGLIFPVPGNLYDSLTVTVDLRRTGGAGFIGCYPMWAGGRQSD